MLRSGTIWWLLSILLALVLALAACGGSANDDGHGSSARGDGGAPAITLELVGRFDQPLHALPVPDTDLVAVVEKGGRVLVVEGMRCTAADACPDEPISAGRTVIDIRDEVSTGSEQGLLGMAFHPGWPDDPRVFINYTDTAGDTRVEAWELDTPKGKARRIGELLRIEQPFPNHNGGHLAFGPDDLLYVGTGDGGSAGDPADRAQDSDELLGKLLRLDVSRDGAGYGIPDGNLQGGAEEAWALGLRNPWRFSFDSKTDALWIADVGQDEREEINALDRSQLQGTTPNFGWRRREGFREFDTSGITGPGRLVQPVLDYGRDEGCSVTGGVVYRGELVPALRGWYLFADFCADDLRLLEAEGVPGTQPARGALERSSVPGVEQVASFAEVQDGEVLVVSLAGGVHQVVAR